MVTGKRSAFLCVIFAGLIIGLTSAACNFEEYANYKGALVIAGDTNLQPDIASCCAACRRLGSNCNVWVWCGNTGGCDNGAGSVYPYRGCDLKLQALFPGDLPEAWARGEGRTRFTSGWIERSS